MSVTLFALLVIAASTVLFCCVVLVFYRDYHAGAIGKFGLGMIALAAISRLYGLLEHGINSWVSPQGVMLWLGLALFLGRHVVKFAWRAAKRGPDWYPRCR